MNKEILNAQPSGDDCPKCGNPNTMYFCFFCGSNQEKKGKCDSCGNRVGLDKDYHLNCD